MNIHDIIKAIATGFISGIASWIAKQILETIKNKFKK